MQGGREGNDRGKRERGRQENRMAIRKREMKIEEERKARRKSGRQQKDGGALSR